MIDSISIFLATQVHVFVVLGGLMAFIFASKKHRWKLFTLSAIALPVILVLSRVASKLFENPRPFVDHGFTPLVEHIADNGFPSDHALLVAAVASIVFAYDRRIGSTLFALAALVGIGRVAVGVHHPLDVIASFAIAAVVTYAVFLMLKYYKPDDRFLK